MVWSVVFSRNALVQVLLLWVFLTMMGFFFFLPKWGPYKKNYKFRQVVPNWDDFICRSRPN